MVKDKSQSLLQAFYRSVFQGALFGIRYLKSNCTVNSTVQTQCIDFVWVPQEQLKPYYFYTMAVSFVIPFIATAISYVLTLSEIKAMKMREQRK